MHGSLGSLVVQQGTKVWAYSVSVLTGTTLVSENFLCRSSIITLILGSGGSAYGALFQPLSTQLSLYTGVLICILSFTGIYARNIWGAANFPFLSQLLFFENGTVYDQTLILNEDFTLNEEKLAAVGLPWFAGSQGTSSFSECAFKIPTCPIQ